MTTLTSSPSFQKYDSGELLQVDISSPRKREKLKFWKRIATEGKERRARTVEKAESAANNTSRFADLSYLAGQSWCVGVCLFLWWRISIFTYLVITLTILGMGGALETFQVSMLAYVGQVISAFFAVLSSTIAVLRIRSKPSREKAEPIARSQVRGSRTGCTVGTNTTILESIAHPTRPLVERVSKVVDVLAVVFIQNSCALAAFGNIVFWLKEYDTEDIRMSACSACSLLHVYNMIPIVFELVIGCAVFKLYYFIPGTVLVVVILLTMSTVSLHGKHGFHELVGASSNGADQVSMVRFLEMFVIYIFSCSWTFLTQRFRQHLIGRQPRTERT